MRRRYIQHPETLELIPAEEYISPVEVNAPMIMPDIQPYKSMATGEMIGGRRQHREHLKQHGLVEVGNERPKPVKRGPDPTIKRDIIEAVQRHSY